MKNFIKGSSILMIGDLLTKVISVLYLIPLVRIDEQITVLMTNLLVPFGFFVVFSTIGINLILTNELVKAKNDDDTKKVLIDVGIILLIVTIMGSVIMLLVSPGLMHKIELNETYAIALTRGAQILAIGVILFSITAYIRSILMAYGDYKIISITYITEQIIKVGIIIWGAYYFLVQNSFDVVVIVYVITFSIIISMITTLVAYLYHFIKHRYYLKFTRGNYQFAFKRIKILLISTAILFAGGVYVTVFDLIDLLLSNTQLLNHGYSIQYIDTFKSEYFTLSMKIVMVPITISSAFIQVMVKQVGESKDNKQEINKIIYFVSIYSLFMLGSIMLMGPNVYEMLYGQLSLGIITIQALMIPMYILKNVIGGYVVTNDGKHSSILISTLIILILKVILDVLLFNVFGIFAYTLSSIISLIVGIIMLIKMNPHIFSNTKMEAFKNLYLYIKIIAVVLVTLLMMSVTNIQSLFFNIIVQGVLFMILFTALYMKDIKKSFSK